MKRRKTSLLVAALSIQTVRVHSNLVVKKVENNDKNPSTSSSKAITTNSTSYTKPSSSSSSSSSNNIANKRIRRRNQPLVPNAIRPSSRNSESITSNQQQQQQRPETSLRLGTESLVDRWTFILDTSHNALADEEATISIHHLPASFANQLRDLENAEKAKKYSDDFNMNNENCNIKNSETITKKSPSKKQTTTSKNSSTKSTRTFTSVSYAIVISTVTILAMTTLTHLSSLLYGASGTVSGGRSNMSIFSKLKAIPFLLTAEYKYDTQLMEETKQKILTYITEKLIPTGLETLQKMILMEVWRTVWLRTFAGMRDFWHRHLFGQSYYESMWETYAPGWLRRGVRAYFVRKVQGDLQVTLGSWISKGWDLMGNGGGSFLWLDSDTVLDGSNTDFNEDSDFEELSAEDEIVDIDINVGDDAEVAVSEDISFDDIDIDDDIALDAES
jgi:hypothetical protein